MNNKPEKEFERKIYKQMLWWKKNKAPKYALFLKGARRVGKSTLAERIGKNEYKSYILIRFDKAPNEIKDLFINSLEDLDTLFTKLQFFYKIYYFKKTDKDRKRTIMEIDFLTKREKKVISIEAKSADSNSIKSLKEFKKSYNCKIGSQYIFHDGDVKVEDDFIYLPYYMI